jgi:predicted short-subunit dehydrogenase-like oxidoreductase (DUF2520 family)
VARTVHIIGPGRAGGSFAGALREVGWDVVALSGRQESVAGAAQHVDLVLITTPDGAIGAVADAIEPGLAVVAHAAGSLGLDVLGPHRRRAAIHPLISLPSPDVGAARLLASGWFAIAGDELAAAVVDDLGGRFFTVADEHRTLYHASACVAANHVVALLGQVERLAAEVGVPVEAYQELTRGSLDAVAQLGAAAALTGPAARGDADTIARHIAALPDSEVSLYEALVAEARRLAAS